MLVGDISSPNKWIVLPDLRPISPISGLVWVSLLRELPRETLVFQSLKYVFGCIMRCKPDYTMWLLVGDRLARKDTRVTRYLQFWGSLRMNKVLLPQGPYIEDSAIKSEDGLRFFSAVNFEIDELHLVCNLKRHTDDTIVCVPRNGGEATIRELVKSGWGFGTHSYKAHPEVVKEILSSGGLVVSDYGMCNDPDSTIVVFGASDQLELIRGTAREDGL